MPPGIASICNNAACNKRENAADGQKLGHAAQIIYAPAGGECVCRCAAGSTVGIQKEPVLSKHFPASYKVNRVHGRHTQGVDEGAMVAASGGEGSLLEQRPGQQRPLADLAAAAGKQLVREALVLLARVHGAAVQHRWVVLRAGHGQT